MATESTALGKAQTSDEPSQENCLFGHPPRVLGALHPYHIPASDRKGIRDDFTGFSALRESLYIFGRNVS